MEIARFTWRDKHPVWFRGRHVREGVCVDNCRRIILLEAILQPQLRDDFRNHVLVGP